MLLPDFEELCSAELLDHKFQVPCDPILYLTVNYGRFSKWSRPASKDFWWPSIVRNGEWTKDEIINEIRMFDKNGIFNKEATLISINKVLESMKEQKLPSFHKFLDY